MTLNEIFNGKDYGEFKFPGLIQLIHIYMDTINVESETRVVVSKYLSFLSKKASGKKKNSNFRERNFFVEFKEKFQRKIVNKSQRIVSDFS
jgi:glutamate--cysteine ligase catalytic subunit